MSDRRAVVTGATGLIGREVVRAFGARGWHVEALDAQPLRDEDHEREGVRVRHHEVDISDPAALAEVAASMPNEVECLVHAAALTSRGDLRLDGALIDIDWSTWTRMVDINVNGALAVVRACIDRLRQAAPSRIVLVGSIQGLVPTTPTGAYGVTKAALGGLCRQLAAEVAADGITVNMVAPGVTTSEEQTGSANPLARTASAAEMAAVIVEIATGSFGFMTGATIPCDGGEHLRPRHLPSKHTQLHGGRDA